MTVDLNTYTYTHTQKEESHFNQLESEKRFSRSWVTCLCALLMHAWVKVISKQSCVWRKQCGLVLMNREKINKRKISMTYRRFLPSSSKINLIITRESKQKKYRIFAKLFIRLKIHFINRSKNKMSVMPRCLLADQLLRLTYSKPSIKGWPPFSQTRSTQVSGAWLESQMIFISDISATRSRLSLAQFAPCWANPRR